MGPAAALGGSIGYGPDPAADEFQRPGRRVPTNVLTYIGWASMPWQDLYDPHGGGLYLATAVDAAFAADPFPARSAAGFPKVDRRAL